MFVELVLEVIEVFFFFFLRQLSYLLSIQTQKSQFFFHWVSLESVYCHPRASPKYDKNMKGRLKEYLMGAFKFQGNCHTKEYVKIFAITMKQEITGLYCS